MSEKAPKTLTERHQAGLLPDDLRSVHKKTLTIGQRSWEYHLIDWSKVLSNVLNQLDSINPTVLLDQIANQRNQEIISLHPIEQALLSWVMANRTELNDRTPNATAVRAALDELSGQVTERIRQIVVLENVLKQQLSDTSAKITLPNTSTTEEQAA